MPDAAAADNLAIDLHDVAKRYKGRIDALKGIAMQVRRGEIFGLLGPNGAGKSTLVKIIMTIVRPTRCAGSVLEQPIGHKPTLGRMGYLPENHRFPRYLTGRQTIEFFGALSNVDRPTRKRRAAELLETVNMKEAADRKISTYSKGMAQRIGLAQALVNDPDLILLDEPTDGVDPVGRREIRDVLVRLREQGKTVFINSHLLSELEMICDRVAILVLGQVARQGTVADLSSAMAKQRYEIEIAPNGQPMRPFREILNAKTQMVAPAIPVHRPASFGVQPALHVAERGTLPTGEWVEIEGPILRIGVADPFALQSTIDALRAAGAVIQRVQPVRASLEDIFMEAVGANGGGDR
jgi:ABC-2 type transport system ATP-binding protein